MPKCMSCGGSAEVTYRCASCSKPVCFDCARSYLDDVYCVDCLGVVCAECRAEGPTYKCLRCSRNLCYNCIRKFKGANYCIGCCLEMADDMKRKKAEEKGIVRLEKALIARKKLLAVLLILMVGIGAGAFFLGGFEALEIAKDATFGEEEPLEEATSWIAAPREREQIKTALEKFEGLDSMGAGHLEVRITGGTEVFDVENTGTGVDVTSGAPADADAIVWITRNAITELEEADDFCATMKSLYSDGEIQTDMQISMVEAYQKGYGEIAKCVA